MPSAPQAKFSAFPDDYEHFRSPADCHAAYDRGWMGCIPNEASKERFRELVRETSGYGSFADAAHDRGFAGSGAGKLVLNFLAVEALWPDAFPGEAQQTGCCVSMGTRGALRTAYARYYFSRRAQGLPEIPKIGIHTGAFHNAPIYWYRGYNGDGWDCATAATVAVKHVGLVPCRDWGDVDLTHCNAHNDHLYGSQQPPRELIDKFGDHRAASAAEIHSFDELMDALAAGCGVNSCGSEGFSGHRNEDGIMDRTTSWSHSMEIIGADARPVVMKKYGCPIIYFPQSWGVWGSGPRRVLDTEIDTPVGTFGARWDDVKHRYIIAFTFDRGWEPSPLDGFGGTFAFN